MENIQVSTRLRPLSKKELSSQEKDIWQINQTHNKIDLLLEYKKLFNRSQKSSFIFDHCLPTYFTNEDIYLKTIRDLMFDSLEGINSTIFVYGQTGSGKTHTMLGPKEETNEKQGQNEKGVVGLGLRDLFDRLEMEGNKTYVVKCSYIEIYNDNIYDLFSNDFEHPEAITISEDINHDFYLKGVMEETVSTYEEAVNALKKGENNRHNAATNMNHLSSRSHTIFKLSVKTFTNCQMRQDNTLNHEVISNATKNKSTVITEACINFVDLAGSEKISNHFNQTERNSLFERNGNEDSMGSKLNDRLREGKFINKSLFFLTQVISLKSENKSNVHIPYRNSPLTKILKNSLGGNSRTLIILCICPGLKNYEQSISTFRFGCNAKNIENKIEANVLFNDPDETIKLLTKEYERKIRNLELERNNYRLKFEKQARFANKLKFENKTLTNKILHCTSNNNNKNLLKSPRNSVKIQENAKISNNLSYLTSAGLLFSNRRNNNDQKTNNIDLHLMGREHLKNIKDLKEDPSSYEFLRKSVEKIKNGILNFCDNEWGTNLNLKTIKTNLTKISQEELAQKEKKIEKKLFEIKNELSKRKFQKYKPLRNQYFKFDSPVKPLHPEKEKFKQKLIQSVFGSIDYDILQLKKIAQPSNENSPSPLEPKTKRDNNDIKLRKNLLNYNEDFSSIGSPSKMRRRNTYSFTNNSFHETQEFQSFLEKENSELSYLKEQRRKTIAREEQSKQIKNILEEEIKRPSSSKYIMLDTTHNHSKNSFYSDYAGALEEEDSFYFRKIKDLKKNAESVKNLVHSISNSKEKNGAESLLGKEPINDFFSEKDISLNLMSENLNNFVTNSDISIMQLDGEEKKRRSRKERNDRKK